MLLAIGAVALRGHTGDSWVGSLGSHAAVIMRMLLLMCLAWVSMILTVSLLIFANIAKDGGQRQMQGNSRLMGAWHCIAACDVPGMLLLKHQAWHQGSSHSRGPEAGAEDSCSWPSGPLQRH